MSYLLFSFLTLGILLFHDIFSLKSKYLYFSTEIGLLLACSCVYLIAFKNPSQLNLEGKKVNVTDINPSSKLLKLFILLTAFSFLGGFMPVWINEGLHGAFLKSRWMIFWFSVFVASIGVSYKALSSIRYSPLIKTSILMTAVLSAYEILLLSQGKGWFYNGTIFQSFFGVPFSSAFFVYPIAPALAVLIFLRFSDSKNIKKSFWIINLLLAPASILVEYIGIDVLKLWTIYNENSILPMGWTNLEEILYYILSQFFAISFYLMLTREKSNA